MASLGYPGQRSRTTQLLDRNRLSSDPIGPNDVRNPNRTINLGVDLRNAGTDLARVPGQGPVLHGEIIPPGRNVPSTVNIPNTLRQLTIEGELGRPNSAKAKRLRAILEGALGKGALLGMAGLLGFDLEGNFQVISDAVAEGWTHPNGSLQSTCSPAVLPGALTWIGHDLLTGHTSQSCTRITRNAAIDGNPQPNSAKYPQNTYGSAATTTGYTLFRWSNHTGSFCYFQQAERYNTINPANPLGPVWQDASPAKYWPIPKTSIDLHLHDYSVNGPSRQPRTDRPRKNKFRAPYTRPAIDMAWDIDPTSRPRDRPSPRPRTEPDPRTRYPHPPKPPRVTYTDHVVMPPGRVRERKRGIATGLLFKLVVAAGVVTEGCEMVDELYKALPWQLTRWKGRDGQWRNQHITCHMKAIAVAMNYQAIDVDKAIKGMIENWIKDFIIGRMNKKALEGVLSTGYWWGSRGPNVSRLASGEHQEAINELLNSLK